jgi:hypothetical protein
MAVSGQLTPSDPAVLYVGGGMGPRGGHDALEKRKSYYLAWNARTEYDVRSPK